MPVCERPSSTWLEICCKASVCLSAPSSSFSRLVPKKSCKRKKTTHSAVWRLNFFAFFFCCSARIQDGRPHLHLPLLLICPVHHIHHHEGHYYRHDGRWGHCSPAAGHISHVAFIMVFKFTPLLHPLDSGTPPGLKYSEVRESLLAVKGVTAVHNLHIWALTMNQAVLSAHVALGEMHIWLNSELIYSSTILQNFWADWKFSTGFILLFYCFFSNGWCSSLIIHNSSEFDL